jgi:glycosyltransferase involved in cell wall biosynthesis
MKVAVVTPTIGAKTLSECIQSVDAQTYENLTHYLFLDGREHESKIWHQLEGATKVKTVRLEENVGQGWYGHRVYAACSFLVNADVICYLDEDNWIEPNHVEKLVQVLNEGNDWAYSLRKIYDKEGNYLCEDNCESLGKWPVYFNDSVHHIDTSSFAVRRDVAVAIGHAWYGQWGADRQFFSNLKKVFPKYNCSNEYSLCYRLDGNPNSVTHEFFEKGNKVTEQKYNKNYPWLKREKTLHEIGPGIKIIA